MGPSSLVARRCRAQLLAGPPARTPTAVAERLLAIQAQDQRGFRLAIRARTDGLLATAVDRALTEERSLVVAWLNRGTLHLVRSEDYWWLHALTAPATRPANDRRLAQTGVSAEAADRGVRVVVGALSESGPLGRDELRSRLAAAGVPTAGQALIHVLLRASLDGLIVRGPVVGGEHRYALVADWLGARPAVDGDRALAELARRYLAGHGPATDRDLASWAGVGLGPARAGLRAIAADLVEESEGLVALAARGEWAGRGEGVGRDGSEPAGRDIDDPAAAAAGRPRWPPPRLLGAFDPLLHGWRDRRALLGDNQQVVTVNGIFRPVLLAGGRAVATWTLSGGRVRILPFRPLSTSVLAAARREAAAVGTFLGLGVVGLEIGEAAPSHGR